MGRGWGDYVRDFVRNLHAEDVPPGRWVQLVVKNRLRAATRGCCGNRGQPGC